VPGYGQPAGVDPAAHRTALGQVVQRREQLRATAGGAVVEVVGFDPEHDETLGGEPGAQPGDAGPRAVEAGRDRYRAEGALVGRCRVVDSPATEAIPARHADRRYREGSGGGRDTGGRRIRAPLIGVVGGGRGGRRRRGGEDAEGHRGPGEGLTA
jgi:hypothetical protein